MEKESRTHKQGAEEKIRYKKPESDCIDSRELANSRGYDHLAEDLRCQFCRQLAVWNLEG
jgi:hypothetical protein